MKKKCDFCNKEAKYFKIGGAFSVCEEHKNKLVELDVKNSDI